MGFFSQIGELLSFVLRWSRGLRFGRTRIVVIILLGILSGLANAGLVAVINTSLTASSAMLWPFVALCIALPLSRLFSGVLLNQLTTTAVYQMRIQLSRKVIAAPLRKLEELGPSKLLATLTSDVPSIVGALGYFPMLLMQVFIILGSLAYLAWLSWSAFLGVLVFMALGLFTYQLPVSRANRYVAAARESVDLLMKSFRALTEGTKELKLHHRRRNSFFDELLEPAADEMRRSRFMSEAIFVGATSWGHVLFFILVGLLIFGLPQLQTVDTEVLTGYTLAILYMITPILGVLDSLPTLAEAAVGVEKIDRLGLTLDASGGDLRELAPTALPISNWQSLELRGVTHSYHLEAEDRDFTLGPIDLTIKPGELLFITGGNGSGKTTLAKLLAGLYLPEQGEIRLAGKSISDENREVYRQYFTVVFSDFFIFQTLLGLEQSNLDGVAKEYLQKLLLQHKVTIENGRISTIKLSQGQRKRLALLTAYLEDRPIYLFDEWAADQDPEFKAIFYHQLLPELKERGKTAIVISHDDRYYAVADRIIKLDTGQITSDRSRADLVAL